MIVIDEIRRKKKNIGWLTTNKRIEIAAMYIQSEIVFERLSCLGGKIRKRPQVQILLL